MERCGWALPRLYNSLPCVFAMEEGGRQHHNLSLVHLETPSPNPFQRNSSLSLLQPKNKTFVGIDPGIGL